jgi:hypothetical protein
MGLAAVPWDRRETYEAGGLGVLETPELGRLDDEHVCGHLADAWNARQDLETLAQVRVCVAQCFEASIDRFDLAGDLAQPLSELTFDEGRDGDGPAVEGGDAPAHAMLSRFLVARNAQQLVQSARQRANTSEFPTEQRANCQRAPVPCRNGY